MQSSQSDDLPGAIVVAAELEQVRSLAAWLKDACERARIAEPIAFDLELAMVEAANNVVLHGYDGGPGSLALSFHVEGGTAFVVLADKGAPIPSEMLSECRAVPADATHGRGFTIMRSCVDALDYASQGAVNVLTFSKRI